MTNAHRFLILGVGMLTFAGCGNPDPHKREPLEGTVTFHGKPIAHANVLFSGEDGSTAFDTGSLVLAGRYQIKREFGLPPGRYRARISYLEPVGKGKDKGTPVLFPGDEGEAKLQQMIPAAFSTEGITVEVVAGKLNVFDFDIP